MNFNQKFQDKPKVKQVQANYNLQIVLISNSILLSTFFEEKLYRCQVDIEAYFL